MNKQALTILALVAVVSLVTGTVSIAEAQKNDEKIDSKIKTDLNLPEHKIAKDKKIEKLLDRGKPIENLTGVEDFDTKKLPAYVKYATKQKEFGDYGVEKVYTTDKLKPIKVFEFEEKTKGKSGKIIPPEFTEESKNRDYVHPSTIKSSPGFKLSETIRNEYSTTAVYTDNDPNTPDVYVGGSASFRVADYDGEYKAPYYLREGTNFIQVETAEGSFTWDKSTCAVTFYEHGLIEAGENPLISSDSLTFFTTIGNSPNWQEMPELNNAACITEVIEDGFNIEIRGTKTASDAEAVIRYIKINGELLKPQIEITNLNYDWKNQKFGVKQTLHPNSTIYMGNDVFDITKAKNGDESKTRDWIVENDAQVIGLGDDLIYDLSEGAPYIKSIDMVYEDNQAKLVLDYRNNDNGKPGIGPGETWILDPVYGEPRDWYSRSLYDSSNNDLCDTFVDGGVARYAIKYSAATATSDCYRTVISWYADWIPKTADVQRISHIFSTTNTDAAYPNYVDLVLLAPNVVPYRNIDNTAPPIYSQMGQNCDEIYGINSHQAPTQGPGLDPDIRNTVIAYGRTGGDTGDALTRGFDSNLYNQEYDVTAGHAGYRADEILEQRLSNGISNWDICFKLTEDDPNAAGPFSESTGVTHHDQLTDNNYPDFTFIVEYTLPLPTKPTTSVITNQDNLKVVETIVNSTTWDGTYGEALDILGYVWKRTTTNTEYSEECHEPFTAGCSLVTRVGFDGPANGLRDLVIGNLTGITTSSNSTIGLENLVVEFDFDKSTSGVLFYDNFNDNSYVEDWLEITDPNNEQDEINNRLEVSTDHVENADNHRMATQDRYISSTGIYVLTWYELTPTTASGAESYTYLACGDASWDDNGTPDNAISIKNKVDTSSGDGILVYDDGPQLYGNLGFDITDNSNYKLVYNDNINEISAWYWDGSEWIQIGITVYGELNDDAQGCGIHSFVYDDSAYTGVTTVYKDNIYLLDKDFQTQFPTIIYNQATLESVGAVSTLNDNINTYVNQTVRVADIDLDFTEYSNQLEFDDAWVTTDITKYAGNSTNDEIDFNVVRDSSQDIIVYPLGFELTDNFKATWEMTFDTNTGDTLGWFGFRDDDGATPYNTGTTGNFLGYHLRGTGASGGLYSNLCAFNTDTLDQCYPGGPTTPDDNDTFTPVTGNSTIYYFELEAKDGDYELNIYNNALKTIPDIHGNEYTTSVLTNGEPLLGTGSVTGLDNFVIFNYGNDSVAGEITGTLDNLKIWRGTDTYATPDYEKESYIIDDFRYYSDNNRVANFTDNFSTLDTDGDGNDDWINIGSLININTGLSEPALEWETESNVNHGRSITLLPDNDRNSSGSFLGTWGDSMQGDGATVSDDAWTLRFKLDIDEWTEVDTNDESIIVALSDSDVNSWSYKYQDMIAFQLTIDNSGSSAFEIIATNNGWEANVNDDDYIPIGDPDVGGYIQNPIEQMKTVPAEGVYYVELSRTSHTTVQLCLYLDQTYEAYSGDTKIRECVVGNIDPGIIDLDTLKIQTRVGFTDSSNVATGIIDDIQFYDKTHTIAIPDDNTNPLQYDLFDTYSTTKRTADAVWGQNANQVIEDGTTYTNQTNFDTNWVTNDNGKARGNLTSDRIEINHTYDESNDAISFDLGVIPDDAWTLRFKTNFSTITPGANTTTYFGVFDKNATMGVESTHDGIGFTLVHDDNPQGLDILDLDTIEGVAIANITGTGTVTVTTSVNHNMTSGQQIHIEDTTNFDVEYLEITVITPTTFTYEDAGHGTPETSGKVIPARMEFDPSNPTLINGWSQIGSTTEIEDGKIHHDATPRSVDHRVFKELSEKLSDEKWTIEFEFEVDTAGASAQVCIICLTSESETGVENPYLTAPDQDMVGFEEYWNGGIRLVYKDDTGAVVRGTEPDGGATTTVITNDVLYYGTFKRLDASTIELSVFTDAARTTHNTDSPRYLKIPESIQDLSIIQSSSDEQSGASGTISMFIDNISVYNEWNGYENTNYLSGTERGIHTIQALDLDDYTKHQDDIRIWNGDFKEIWEPVGSSIGVKQWEPIENTDYWIEISRLSPISYETTIFTDANYTEQVIKVAGISSNNTSNLQFFKIAQDDNLGDGQLTFSVDDLELFSSTHTVNIPIESNTTDIWGKDTDQSIEDFTTYLIEADSDASWISDNENTLDVDLANDRLNWATETNLRDHIYYDMGILDDEQFALRYHMKINTDEFNGTTNNKVELYYYVSAGIGDTASNDDSIGFSFTKNFLNTEFTELRWADDVSIQNAPTGTYDMELKPEIDDYYIQLSRSNSTEYSLTFFSDPYYTTAIESMNATIPATIDTLRYFHVGYVDLANGEDVLNGWIDDIQLYNGTQDSRILGQTWLQEMESNQVFIDLDRETIYFDLTDNQEPKGISYELPDEASDNTWALRFEVNLENLVQGPHSGWANSDQFINDNKECNITSESVDGWGLAFKPDGTKMFITNSAGSDDVYEYSLNTPWDVSTCVLIDSYDHDAETGETLPTHIAFNTDGTKMYIVGYTLDTVEEFTCATGFDISTCSDAASPLAIGGTMGTNVYGGMAWSPNGEKLFIAEDVSVESLYEWDCAAWDVSTCTYNSNILSLTAGGITPEGVAFNYNTNYGDLPGYSDKYNSIKLYVNDANGDELNTYICEDDLFTPDGSIADCVYEDRLGSLSANPRQHAFSSDGTKWYYHSWDGHIYQFSSVTDPGVALFVGLSDQDASEQSRYDQDFIGFMHKVNSTGNYYKLVDTEGGADTESPWDLNDSTYFETIPETGKLFVQVERISPIKASMTLYTDSSYTTAIESIDQPVSLDTKNLNYIRVFTNGDTPESLLDDDDDGPYNQEVGYKVDGYIDNIQFFNSTDRWPHNDPNETRYNAMQQFKSNTQESREWAHEWYPQDEDKIFVDLDNDAIYFDVKRDGSDDSISRHINTLDSQHSLRGSLDLSSVVQGADPDPVRLFIGMTSDGFDSSVAKDWAGFDITTGSGTVAYTARLGDETTLTAASSQAFTRTLTEEKLWFDISIDNDEGGVEELIVTLYSDANYTTPVEFQGIAMPAQAQYVEHFNYPTSSQAGGLAGWIDSAFVTEETSTTIPGSTPLDDLDDRYMYADADGIRNHDDEKAWLDLADPDHLNEPVSDNWVLRFMTENKEFANSTTSGDDDTIYNRIGLSDSNDSPIELSIDDDTVMFGATNRHTDGTTNHFRYGLDVSKDTGNRATSGGYTGTDYGTATVTDTSGSYIPNTRVWVEVTANSTGYYGCTYTDATYTTLKDVCAIDNPTDADSEDLADPYQGIDGLRYLIIGAGSHGFAVGETGRLDMIYDDIYFCNDVETMSPEWNCANGISGLDTIWIGNEMVANADADSTLVGWVDDIEVYDKVPDARDWAAETGTSHINENDNGSGPLIDGVRIINNENVLLETNWYSQDELQSYVDLDREVLVMDVTRDDTNDQIYSNPLGNEGAAPGNGLSDEWIFRVHGHVKEIIQGNTNDLNLSFGLSDTYDTATTGASYSQDFFGFFVLVDSTQKYIDMRLADGAAAHGGIDYDSSLVINEGDDLYFELIRSGDLFIANIYDDSEYSNLIHSGQERDSGVQELRFVSFMNIDDATSATSNLIMEFDDFELYDDVSPFGFAATGSQFNSTSNGGDIDLNAIGVRAEAYLFDGDDDEIVIPYPTLNMHYDQKFSVSAWIYPTAASSNDMIFSNIDPATGYKGFQFHKTTANDYQFNVISTVTTDQLSVDSNNCEPTIDEWHHVVVVYDPKDATYPIPSDVEIYQDGVKCDSTAGVNTFTTGDTYSAVDTLIGDREDGGYDFNGKIDDFFFFTRALTQGEVLAYYNDGNSIDPITGEGSGFGGLVENDNLLIHYDFDTLQSADRNIHLSGLVNTKSVTSQEDAVQGFTWNNDGTKLFVIGQTGDDVNEYLCDTEYLPSSCNFTSVDSVAGFTSDPRDIIFNDDGTKAYILGHTEQAVSEWSGTAFDFSTFTDSSSDLDISSQETAPQDIAWNDDGTKFFLTGGDGDINEYSCTTYDVSTCSFTDATNLPNTSNGKGLEFNTIGTKLYVADTLRLYEYNLTSFDTSTLEPTGIYFDMDDTIAILEDVYYRGGDDLFAMDTTGENIHKFVTIPTKSESTLTLQNPTITEFEDFTTCQDNDCGTEWLSSDKDTGNFINIDTTNDNIDFQLQANNSTDADTITHLIEPLTDTFTVRGHLNIDGTSGDTSIIYIGVSDKDYTFGADDNQDFIGLYIRQTAGYDGSGFISSAHSDGGVPSTSGAAISVLELNQDYYWEIVRLHDLYYVAIYSDSDFNDLIAYESGLTTNTNELHKYIKIMNLYESPFSGTINGTIDWITVYDQFATFGAVGDAQAHGPNVEPGGYFDQAYELDGVDDYIEINTDILDGLSRGTLSMWFKVQNAGTTQCIFCASDSGDSNSEIRLVIDEADDGEVEFSVREAGTYHYRVETVGGNYDDGLWHHIAIVVDTNGNKMYIDGLDPEVETTYVSGANTDTEFFDDVLNIDQVSIGKNINNLGDQWEIYGMVDQFKLYERSLNHDEIRTLAESFFVADATFKDKALFWFEFENDQQFGYNLRSSDYRTELAVGNSLDAYDSAFSADGTILTVLDTTADALDKYTCSTAFEINSCSYVGQYSITAGPSNEQHLSVNWADNGDKLFLADNTDDDVELYTCSTSYDPATCTYDSVSNISANITSEFGAAVVSNDGNWLVTEDDVGIKTWAFSDPFNLTSLSLISTYVPDEFTTNGLDIALSDDGTVLWWIEYNGDIVYEYYCDLPFQVHTCDYTGASYDTTFVDSTMVSLDFNPDGTKWYAVGFVGDDVHEFTSIMIENQATITNYNPDVTLEDDFVLDKWIDTDTTIAVNTVSQKLDFDVKRDLTDDTSYIDLGVLDKTWTIDFDMNITTLVNSDSSHNSLYVTVSDDSGASSELQDALGFRIDLISGTSILEIGDVNEQALGNIADLTSSWEPRASGVAYFRIYDLNVFDTTADDWNLFTVEIFNDPERTQLIASETHPHDDTIDFLQYFKVSNLDDETGTTNTLIGTIDNLKVYDGIAVGGETINGAIETTTGTTTVIQGINGLRDNTWDWANDDKFIDLTNTETETSSILDKAMMYDHSFCTWVKPNTVSGDAGTYHYLFSASQDGTDAMQFYYYMPVNNWIVYVQWDDNAVDPTIAYTTLNNEVSTGVWSHLCYTYDENDTTDTLTLYINGVEVASDSGSFAEYDPTNIWIGQSTVSTGHNLRGDIDDVAFFPTLLSSSQIKQMYNTHLSMDVIEGTQSNGTFVYPYFTLEAGAEHFQQVSENPNPDFEDDFSTYDTTETEPDAWYLGYSSGSNHVWDSDGADAYALDFIYGTGSTNPWRTASMDLHKVISIDTPGNGTLGVGSNDYNGELSDGLHVDGDFRFRYSVHYDTLTAGGWDQHWAGLSDCYQGRALCASSQAQNFLGVYVYPGVTGFQLNESTNSVLTTATRTDLTGTLSTGTDYFVDLWTEGDRTLLCGSVSSTNAYDGDLTVNTGSVTGNGGACQALNDKDPRLRYLMFQGYYGTTSTGTVDGHYDDIQYWEGDIGLPSSPVGGGVIFNGDTYYTSDPEVEEKYDFERTDEFTSAVWVRTLGTVDTGADDDFVFGKITNDADERGYQLRMVDSGQISLYIVNDLDGGNYIRVDTDTTWDDGIWHHITTTYDGSSDANGVHIYVDGEEQPTTIVSDTLSGSILNDNNLLIGAESGTDWFYGGMDEFRIYNIVLTPSQISELAEYTISGHKIFDTDVEPDFEYAYRAAGVNQNGIGEFSDLSVPVQPGFTVPDAPTNMTATTFNNDRIDLSWDAPGDDGGQPITGYKIERENPIGGGWSTVVADTGNTATTYSNNILLGGTQYNYRVSAINNVGIGSPSGTDDAYTDFDAPTGFTATPINDDTIRLTWSAPSGGTPTGYTIEREVGIGGGWTVLVDTYTGGVTYDDTPVTLGQTYNYRAYSTGGVPANSTYSSEDDAATLQGADPPDNIVAQVLDVDLDPLNISLSWTAPSFLGSNTVITGYEIDRNVDGGAFSQLVANTTVVLAYNDTTVNPNMTYSYKIKTLGDVIAGQFSNATTPLLVANYTTPPTNFDANILDPDLEPYNVTLTWGVPTNDGGSALQLYTVYRSTDDITYAHYTNTTDLTILIGEPAVGNTTYWYKVAALNGVGYSANATTLITVAGFPSEPTNVILSIPLPDTLPWQINSTWTEPVTDGGSNIVGYTIWRSADGITYSNLTEIGNTTTFLDTTVPAPSPANQTYYYKMQARNLIGYGQNSTAVVINTVDIPSAPNATQLTIPLPNSLPWQINASWSTTDDGGSAITGHTIWRSNDSITYVNVTSIGNQTTFLDTTVPSPSDPNQIYYYKISQKNILDIWGANSTAVSINTVDVPDAPTGAGASILDPGTAPYNITVTWSAPTDNGGNALSGYKVFRSLDDVTYILVATIGNVTTHVDPVPVGPSTTYYYKVSATNILDPTYGANSTSTSVSTGSAPSAPLNLTVQPRIDHTSFYLDWDVPSSDGGSPIIGYQIQINIDDAGWTTVVSNTGNTNTNYVDTGRTTDTNYKYAIYAITIVGGGPGSNVTQGEFTTATLSPVVTPLTGNAIQFDIDVNMTYGIPDSEIYDVELRYWSSSNFVTQISPPPSVSVAKLGAANFTLWDNISETTDYYILVKTRNGVTGEFTEFKTGKLTATPSLAFDDNVIGVEYRNESFNASNLQIIGSPANYDLVVVYRAQNDLDNVIVLTWQDVLTDAVAVTDVDPTIRYYVSAYYEPTFDYTVGASPINGTATIPAGYPVDISLISIADPNQVGFTLGIDVIAGESGIFGLPLVFIFIIALASIFTGRSAPMGIIFIAVALGFMAYMGLVDFNFDPANESNTATWAIIIVAVIVGVMVGKRWD